MATLLLKLAGPLQSWGAGSRFTERQTRHEPTKSGVVGLLAAALGRRRNEPIDDLAALHMGVRVDQPGRLERDFHTAHMRRFSQDSQVWESDKSLPLSQRYYLADAVFVVGVEAPDDLAAILADALQHPAFPLFLGRRSCAPAGKIFLGVSDGDDLVDVLAAHPWEISERAFRRARYARAYGSPDLANDAAVVLPLMRDARPNEQSDLVQELVADVPLSFSPEHRRYGLRRVVHDTVQVSNPYCLHETVAHDPFSALEEVS